MGKHDSSRTRVAPLFDALLTRDDTGASWVDKLLGLGSRKDIAATLPPNQRLVVNHGRRWGKSEASLPAPASLLEYLIQNIDAALVEASGDTGQVRDYRMLLAKHDRRTTDDALESLRAGKRGRKWFVLEGASRPDALLESQDLVVCIEGKRTERTCTTKTTWMRRRNQLIRHMDAALEAFPRKRILGLLIVESDAGLAVSNHWLNESRQQYEPSMLRDSLPHRSKAVQSRIADGILGVTTWRAACDALDVPWNSMPDEA